MTTLTFHGAAGSVTGSRHLLDADGDRLLVDCGMFQGLKDLRALNWAPPAFEARSLRWVVLTHAHIDHSGWLPRLYTAGFRGRILATPATVELAELMLLDSARLQEEDAHFLNKKGATKHSPALPLYNEDDARHVLALFSKVGYGTWTDLSPRLSFRFTNVGHLLGSAMAEIRVEERGGARASSGSAMSAAPGPSGAAAGTTGAEGVSGPAAVGGSSPAGGRLTLLFSGDVGRYDMPLNPDPEPPATCDVLVMESTYGNRSHGTENLYDELQGVAKRTFDRGGILLVPAFAVGRAQQVILVLRELYAQGRLPRAPIHLDSPMAVDATGIYAKYPDEHPLPNDKLYGEKNPLYGPEVTMHRSQEQSKKLNTLAGPAVIISSSGMLTGGRILHHLMQRLPDPRNTVLLVGYQAAGTRGRTLSEGAKTLRFHGEEVAIGAEVATLHGMSGHADADELLRWTDHLASPRTVFLTHGEPDAAAALAARLREARKWNVVVPTLHQSFTL